jgi:hypothetical protein
VALGAFAGAVVVGPAVVGVAVADDGAGCVVPVGVTG